MSPLRSFIDNKKNTLTKCEYAGKSVVRKRKWSLSIVTLAIQGMNASLNHPVS